MEDLTFLVAEILDRGQTMLMDFLAVILFSMKVQDTDLKRKKKLRKTSSYTGRSKEQHQLDHERCVQRGK